MMAAKEKSQDEKNLKTLRELAALPSNKHCFDCQQRGPTYVNVTVGSFVCTTCSGMLRGLHPPHRVKSITMTSFTVEEMEQIKTKGNEYCKQVWLGKYDPSTSTENDYQNAAKVKEFMIQKYEDKKYYIEPEFAVKKPKPRAPSIPTSTVSQSRSQTVIQTNAPNQQIQKPSWTSQNFSSSDNSGEADAFQDFRNESFKPADNAGAGIEGSSFADFGSAFANATSTSSQLQDFSDIPATITSTSVQQPTVQSAASSVAKLSQKKPAPPPPDRYAALADLDNQLHQQQVVQAMPANVPSAVVEPVSSIPLLWSNNTPAMGAVAFNNAGSNPFGHSIPTWSQQNQIPSANPFQIIPSHISNQHTKPAPIPFAVLGNGMTNGTAGENNLQKNGAVTNSFWSATSSQTWATSFPSGQVEAFPNKYSIPAEHYNPWAQSLASESANPFTNGTGMSTSVPQKSSTNNPFL